jgi:hypothetical protein
MKWQLEGEEKRKSGEQKNAEGRGPDCALAFGAALAFDFL